MTRTLETIDRELAAARETLSHVEGTPAEVYSRIVGYYRSVRNWNKGKREEYSERKLFGLTTQAKQQNDADCSTVTTVASEPVVNQMNAPEWSGHLLLFVRSACPACPSAKAAAGRLGIPVNMVNADSAEGLAEAQRYQVYATPTAILFDEEGRELTRAHDSMQIAALDRLVAV